MIEIIWKRKYPNIDVNQRNINNGLHPAKDVVISSKISGRVLRDLIFRTVQRRLF